MTSTPEAEQTKALAAFYAAIAKGHAPNATPAERLAVHKARIRYDAAVIRVALSTGRV